MTSFGWKQRYVRHINSPYWKELKKKVIARRGERCEMCLKSGQQLDLHHKHYKTFGRERQKDVQLLCRPCHKIADQERALRGRISSALSRFDRGVESGDDIDLLSATVWPGRNAKEATSGTSE